MNAGTILRTCGSKCTRRCRRGEEASQAVGVELHKQMLFLARNGGIGARAYYTSNVMHKHDCCLSMERGCMRWSQPKQFAWLLQTLFYFVVRDGTRVSTGAGA
jgi:hypothetical protein